MKKNFKLALIIALLIAVAAVSFGILRLHNARNEKAAGNADGVAAEQLNDGACASPLATLFFASDYQFEEGFDEPSATLGNILTAARADSKTIDEVVMCGDYSNEYKLYDYQVSPDEATEEVRNVVREALALDEANGSPVMFVQGNHDKMTELLTPSGLYERENYLIYILNTEEDFPWKQGKTAGCLAKVRRSSAELKECLDDLIQKGETRPLFIAGHVPLHFTARTSSRHNTGDNLYSSLIFDVVNEAAKSLDIVYLFGHNHSKGWDCYLGGSTVYMAEGDPILIPRFNETDITSDEFTQETLNFTYMNAGYSGYYMNCAPEEYDPADPDRYSAADGALTGTVFEIYGDRINVTRYDTEGVHELGHAGEADPYKGGIDAGLIGPEHYSAETGSPQEIKRK